MKSEVVITGTGLVSALGDRPEVVHRARCEGRGAVALQEFADRAQRLLGAPVAGFDPARYLGDLNLRPLDRIGRLTVCSAKLALESAGISPEFREEHEIDISLGTMFCSVATIAGFDRKAQVSGPKYAMPLEFANTVINAATGQCAIWHNLRGTPMTIAAGEVSGLRAIQYAARQISLGWSNRFLVGGVEEHGFETSWAFSQSGHASREEELESVQPFGVARRGFAPGEAAAFLFLESAEAARERGAEVVGRVLGWGSGYCPAGESEDRRAASASKVISAALAVAGCEAGEIGYVSCPANGSVAGDLLAARVLREFLGARAGEVPIAVPAESFGNTLAASGMLQSLEALQTARCGTLPPFRGAGSVEPCAAGLGLDDQGRECGFERALVFSIGLDGSVSAVILGACQ